MPLKSTMILPEKKSSTPEPDFSVIGPDQVKPTDLKSINKKKGPVTLYNFGYAPKVVIEKFQSFCFNYSTLTEAIINLMKRKRLLIYKYNYISSSVTFQMLARPTSLDETGAIRNALLALHKFTKDGHYKSVADAIEELLLSPKNKPLDQSILHSVCTQTMPTCEANGLTVGTHNYTMVGTAEEIALSKIADAVISKLQDKLEKRSRLQGKNVKYRKRKLLENSSSNASTSPKRQKSPKSSGRSSPGIKNDIVSDTYYSLNNKVQSCDPDYQPNINEKNWEKLDKKRSKRSTMSRHDYTLIHHEESDKDGDDIELPPDIDLLIPLYRLTRTYKPESSKAKYDKLFSLNAKFYQLGSVKLSPCSLDIADKTEELLRTVLESS